MENNHFLKTFKSCKNLGQEFVYPSCQPKLPEVRSMILKTAEHVTHFVEQISSLSNISDSLTTIRLRGLSFMNTNH